MVMFYHMTRSDAAHTVRSLVGRAMAQDWRVMIRGTDHAKLEQLDAKLWLGPEEEFLPHGLQGGAQESDQPVLIGQGPVTNGARALALLDGAQATDVEIAAMERVWILFDGADDARLQAARVDWKRLSSAGIAAQYWSEDSGRWEKKAESGAAS